VPGLETVRLRLAWEILPLWRAVQVETDDPDAPLPYWAFAWAGGLAIARYLQDRPSVVVGRRVLDLASGSGLCAIAAMAAGASRVTAVDIDPMAAAAIELNARANRCRVTVSQRDHLDEPPPDVDVILAGDCWYEAGMAERVTAWLRRARGAGVDVVIGDPQRTYLPIDDLIELERYEVRTTTVLEDLDRKTGYVYAFRDE
jgi:predicted nicotinamide N-methyase